jgi:protein SCO1/2
MKRIALTFTVLSLLVSSTVGAAANMGAPANGASVGGGTFITSKIPADILALPLFDANDKKVSLGSFAGQTLVISNFLTSCHEICPMTTANMRDIGDAVAKAKLSAKVKVLEISVDAGRDTAARLHAYQALFNDSSWSLISGSEANLAKLWAYFGAPGVKTLYKASESKDLPKDWLTGKPDTYDVTHPDLVLIVDAKSNWRWLDLGNPKSNGVIPAKLKSYLSSEGLNNLAKPQEPSWTTSAVFSALNTLLGSKLK